MALSSSTIHPEAPRGHDLEHWHVPCASRGSREITRRHWTKQGLWMRVRDVGVATTVGGEPGTDRLCLSGGWRSHGPASSNRKKADCYFKSSWNIHATWGEKGTKGNWNRNLAVWELSRNLYFLHSCNWIWSHGLPIFYMINGVARILNLFKILDDLRKFLFIL